MNTQGIVDAILTSEDYDERRVIDAIKQRRSRDRLVETATAMTTIKVGTKVRLHGLSPKYLNGLQGVVSAIQGRKAVVDLENQSASLLMFNGAGRFSNPIRVPITCAKSIEVYAK